MTDELNNSVEARSEEIGNPLNERRADVKSLAGTAAVADYYAAASGESTAARERSARQVGYVAVHVRDAVESTAETVTAERYDGRDWATETYTVEGDGGTTQVVPYTYSDRFDWVVASSVPQAEFRQRGVDGARSTVAASFESALWTQTMTVDGENVQPYRSLRLTDADREIVGVTRTGTGSVNVSTDGTAYADAEWFSRAKGARPGRVVVGDGSGDGAGTTDPSASAGDDRAATDGGEE